MIYLASVNGTSYRVGEKDVIAIDAKPVCRQLRIDFSDGTYVDFVGYDYWIKSRVNAKK